MTSLLFESLNPSLLLAINLGHIQGVIIGILGFIVAFGLAVFIHELGHFLAAKAFGVPVERFVIGFDRDAMPFMPPCIIEFKYGETTYGLSVVPLGGYVKMAGVVHPEIEEYLEGREAKPATQQDAPAVQERADGPPREVIPVESGKTLQDQALQDMQALYRKPFWQKVIIYGAGVVMNLILAMIVITILFTKGFEESAAFPAEVGWLSPDSPYSQMGVSIGDKVVSVDGHAVKDSEDLMRRMSAEFEIPGKVWQLVLKRADGAEYTVSLELPADSQAQREFAQTFMKIPPYIDGVVINGAADKAGIQAGDLVTKIDGNPITNWYELRGIIRSSYDKELTFGILRNNAEIELKVKPREDPAEKGVGQLGIAPGNKEREFVKEPFLIALSSSPQRTWNFTVRYMENLKRLGGNLISGKINVVRHELGGPVGIAQMAYRQAQKGMNDWLKFLVMLNIALAVMNSLPLPVLDGGHICFAAWEAIFRKPVPPKILVPVLNGAVVFLLVFVVLVTFNDVLKIFL